MKKNPENWFQVVQQKLDEIARALGIPPSLFTEGTIALASGFIIGFIAKKYGRPVISSVILVVALLACLNHFSIITIEWSKVKALLGLSHQETMQSVVHHITDWMSNHTVPVIIGGGAFFIGYFIA